MASEFTVQRAALKGEWKTICSNPQEAYARDVYDKQCRLAAVGKFRLVSPEGKVLKEKTVTPFSEN